MVAVWSVNTGDADAEKVVEEPAAGTVTEAGTASAGASLVRVTVVPPAGAALDRVTVQVAAAFAPRLLPAH